MTGNVISIAEDKIASILADLERQTEGYVRSVEIDDIETTDAESARPRLIRKVFVKLDPKPGTSWSGS